ncbi:FAR1-related sequence 5-like protein [Tanacetum coccineum]
MLMEPLEFEEKWSKLIEDFDLQNYKWMTKMFRLREIWIPTYFINSLLFGLMRTTSRSESENSFFKSFTSLGSTLVNFMMSYEAAMERQRYRLEKLDFKTLDAAPKCETKLAIERCETVMVRDKAATAYRTLYTKNGKEQAKQSETVA